MPKARAVSTQPRLRSLIFVALALALAVQGPLAVTPAFADEGFTLGGPSWPSNVMYYRVNANCNAPSVDEAALIGIAAGGWNAAGSPFRFVYGGPAGGSNYLGNGVNEIYWTSASFGTVQPAKAQMIYSPLSGDLSEVDIVLSNSAEWHWGDGGNGTLDVASVAVHELGHALSLGDRSGDADRANVMYGVIRIGSQHRTLGPGDIAGIRAIYGTGAPAAEPVPAPMLTIGASATSVYVGRPFVLSGLLKPGRVGDPVVVYVRKPYKSYWSYSSKRLVYAVGTAGGAWWYRYTPYARTSPRGVYYFKAAFAGDASRAPSVSGVVKVTVR